MRTRGDAATTGAVRGGPGASRPRWVSTIAPRRAELALERVGVVVAGGEDERPAGADHAGRVTLASSGGEPRSVRSPGNSTGPPDSPRTPIVGRARTLLCRSEATVKRGRPRSDGRSPGY